MSAPATQQLRRDPVRRVAEFLVRDRKTGERNLWQWPNPAITVWAITQGVRLASPADNHREKLRWVASGALIVWSADELLRGNTPLRRVIGFIVVGREAPKAFR
jgi:hypothetical protein